MLVRLLQSFSPTADCCDTFLNRDLRSNLCHYQSARPPWCHPDAPSWNTHQPLCLLHLRFLRSHSGHALTQMQMHTHGYILCLLTTPQMFVLLCVLTHTSTHTHVHKPPLSEMGSERQISYYSSLSLACWGSVLTHLATWEDPKLN